MALQIYAKMLSKKRLYLFTMSSVIYQKICFAAYSHQHYGHKHLESTYTKNAAIMLVVAVQKQLKGPIQASRLLERQFGEMMKAGSLK